jgi:hypothetical protein
MTTAVHPAPTRNAPGGGAVSLRALWFGLFGAPLAWSIQELVSYATVSHACYPSWEPLTLPRFAGTWTIAFVVSLLTLALGVAAALTAWRSWRRTKRQDREETDAEARQAEIGEGRTRFMAMSGLIVSGMVLYNMVLNGLTLFLVPPCG